MLAAALARDEEVREQFPDGIFWVTLGASSDVVAAQLELLSFLGLERRKLRSASEGLAMLREALAERGCLVVVDDVWSVAAAVAFDAAGPRGRVLYTTRDPAVLDGVGAEIERIDVLSVDAARELLRSLARVRVLPADADDVLRATGRAALAVALVGATIGKGGRSWKQIVDELDRGGETFLDHPYADIFKAMQVAIASLSDSERCAYQTLAVYPEDTAIPIAAVARLWSHVFGATAEWTHQHVQMLAAEKLVALETVGIAFHDLQREFLLLQTEEQSLLHADLLAAYRPLLPAENHGWAQLPQDEPYIWEHLLHHLRGSGDGPAVKTLAGDLGYLALRSFRNGPYAVESDLRQAAYLWSGTTITSRTGRCVSTCGPSR